MDNPHTRSAEEDNGRPGLGDATIDVDVDQGDTHETQRQFEQTMRLVESPEPIMVPPARDPAIIDHTTTSSSSPGSPASRRFPLFSSGAQDLDTPSLLPSAQLPHFDRTSRSSSLASLHSPHVTFQLPPQYLPSHDPWSMSGMPTLYPPTPFVPPLPLQPSLVTGMTPFYREPPTVRPANTYSQLLRDNQSTVPWKYDDDSQEYPSWDSFGHLDSNSSDRNPNLYSNFPEHHEPVYLAGKPTMSSQILPSPMLSPLSTHPPPPVTPASSYAQSYIHPDYISSENYPSTPLVYSPMASPSISYSDREASSIPFRPGQTPFIAPMGFVPYSFQPRTENLEADQLHTGYPVFEPHPPNIVFNPGQCVHYLIYYYSKLL